jgi:bifunctional UDP-N-acetylglucosamine pyrophosphorylase/glucosamine-1-phosphate N-acetyltransferase/UDP-N-acetylglucosamine pyrophosphorylase
MNNTAAIILAAGKGTRMKSDLAKVLHEISGEPMIRYVVETSLKVTDDVFVVIGHQAEAVKNALGSFDKIRFVVQHEQLGTGHAVLTALPELPAHVTDVIILCGDTPLIKPPTLEDLLHIHMEGSRYLTILTTALRHPVGYGRIVLNSNGDVLAIVEEADATEKEKEINLVNTGTYCINSDFLKKWLPDLTSDNAQGEFYLTDVVSRAYQEGVPAAIVEAENSMEVLGVNTINDLAVAESLVSQGAG